MGTAGAADLYSMYAVHSGSALGIPSKNAPLNLACLTFSGQSA